VAKRGKTAKRLYYKIGEACKLVDIQPYVLRYWETEFPALSPSKSRSGQRVYSEKELEVIRRIKQLLYEEGYTIAGAKKKLDAELAAGGVEEGEATAGESEKEPAGASGAGSGGSSAAPETAGELDTRGAEEIEHLRAGIEKLLGEARELLTLLGPKPS
jgi:DNA-binding transcriptional MerR regulator